ncbi:MAG TPA: hypothetical protein VJN18_01775 [Polyangiaceae bacterium]|nr:hypothetical protein [Polyangiaceae bacterium]
MSLLLRPFQEFIAREQGRDALSLVGQIVGTRFVIRTIGRDVPLETVQVGDDDRGLYALVNECEVELGDGFWLQVEAEYSEDLPPGAVVHLFLRGSSPSGLPAGTFVPHERAFAVHFDCAGNVDGRGSVLSGDAIPPVAN